MILSKQFFNLFHAYARKNNMWILDQPLSPQLPDLGIPITRFKVHAQLR